MEGKNLYHLIYGYLLARIHFGFYPKGEHLPSIHKLSRLFGVSTMAVRGALKLLEEEGYITGETKRKNVVIYDAVTPGNKLPDCLSIKEEDLLDLHKSFDLIFPDIFFYGLIGCGEEEVRELYQILERPTVSWDEPTVDFLAHVVMSLKNSLLLDLYYDVILFAYPSYLSFLARDADRWKRAYDDLRTNLFQLLALKQSQNSNALWETMQRAYPDFGPDSDLVKLPERDSIYQWGKPQLCISSSNEIVRRIFFGRYPVNTFLPSVRVLAEELDTAVITMRRSIVLLNDLGVVESINGRGTRVLPPEQGIERVKWRDPAIQKNILLFLESLHILTITCRPLTLAAFPNLSRDDFRIMAKELEAAKDMEHEGIVFAVLTPICAAARLPALKVIYDRLMSLLVWGIPFSNMQPLLRIDCYTEQLISGLTCRDAVTFTAALEQALSAAFLYARSKAVSVGITEAARLKLPFEETYIKNMTLRNIR